MNRKLFALIFAGLCAFPALLTGGDAPERTITVLWKNAPAEVSLQAENGRIGSVRAVRGQATRREGRAPLRAGAEAAVACRIDSARTQAGPESTLIHVRAGSGSFSFFLRDVGSENPIYIPAYGTIVLPGGDDRSYDEAENDILSRKNLTKIQRIEREPETSFASGLGPDTPLQRPDLAGTEPRHADVRDRRGTRGYLSGRESDQADELLLRPSYCPKRLRPISNTATRWDAAWASWTISAEDSRTECCRSITRK